MDLAAFITETGAPHLSAILSATAHGDSPVQRFYRGATVLVTGGSGFIGKQLVEKLYRSCDIKKIFLLLRANKKTVKERVTEILTDSVFDSVKEQKANFVECIHPVQGDISEIRLGISDDDWRTITNEVQVIFHVAATTRFNERLREATLINVRGAREALLLGKCCLRLRSFVHVSTAFSHATLDKSGGEVREEFYRSPLPPETLIHMAENVDDTRLDDITSSLIRGWPNTYTFTKAVAEEEVRAMSADLPVCIVRPAIVIASYREPEPGWLDVSCAFSASGIIISAGLGLSHVVQAVDDTDMNVVPVDYVTNALIAAGWDVGTRQKTDDVGVRAGRGDSGPENTTQGVTARQDDRAVRTRMEQADSKRQQKGDEGVRPGEEESQTVIYSVVTAQKNKIVWRDLMKYLLEVGVAFPTPSAIWKCSITNTKYYPVFLVLSALLHFIPALLVDSVLFVVGKRPRFLKLHKKIHKLSVSLAYFINNLHKMDDRNLSNLREKMSQTDKTIFNFDMKPIDWKDFVKIWCIGVRKNLLKDGLKDTEKAKRKQFWFGIANYVIFAIYCYLFWIITSGAVHVVSTILF